MTVTAAAAASEAIAKRTLFETLSGLVFTDELTDCTSLVQLYFPDDVYTLKDTLGRHHLARFINLILQI